MNIGANESHPIYCCLCLTSDTSLFKGQPIWQCSIITPSLSSGESVSEYTMSRFPRNVTCKRKSVYFSIDHSRGQKCITAIEEQLLFSALLTHTLLFQFH